MNVIRKRIKEEKDLQELQDMWNTFADGSDMTAFQSYEWHRLLLKEWSGWKLHNLYSQCYIYIALKHDHPIMMFPLIIYRFSTKTKWFGSRKGIYLMGQGSYSDYMNVIYRKFDPEAFEAIHRDIKKDFPTYDFYLTNVREDTELTRYLLNNNVSGSFNTVALSVKKKASRQEYQASLSKKCRANLRKSLNRIHRDNLDYRLELYEGTPDQELLSELVRIHIQRVLIKNTKHDGFLHVLSSYVRKAYRKYRDLNNNIIAMSMAENKDSLLFLVRINEEIAGYQYAIRDKIAFRLLQTSFDERFKFYSPLFRGTYELILQTYDDDTIKEIDFTRGDEDFKYRLGGEEINLYDYIL